MSGFYLTLPHNAGGGHFTNNTRGNYTVKLPHEIRLSDRWEVGMSELHYTHSWKNFIGGRVTLNDNGKSYKFKVPSGFYEDERRLVNKISDLIKYWLTGNELEKTEAKIHLEYDDITRCVVINIKKDEFMLLEFNQQLADALGVPTQLTRTYESHKPVSLTEGLTTFYVYCNILEYGIVGNTLAPLLRLVNVQGKDNETVLEKYDMPQYKPLLKHNFDTVEIDIKSDRNETVAFDFGKVIVTLHFRLKSLV